MPAMMGKAKTQQRLIDNLEDEFGKVLSTLSIYFFCGDTWLFTKVSLLNENGDTILGFSFHLTILLQR